MRLNYSTRALLILYQVFSNNSKFDFLLFLSTIYHLIIAQLENPKICYL